MRERPAGITILAIIFIVLGLLSILWSMLIFGFGGLSWLTGSLFSAENLAAFGNANLWAGVLGAVSAVIQIVVGIGLLAMQRWAWILAFLSVLLTAVQGIIGLFAGGIGAFCCGTLGLIVPIGILIYLLSRGVRETFGM